MLRWFCPSLICLSALFLFCFSTRTVAQLPGGLGRNGSDVSVRVIAPSGRPVGRGAHVRLQAVAGPTLVADTDGSGAVTFRNVAGGTYRALVKAEGYEETDGGRVEVDSQQMSQMVFVYLRRADEDLVVSSAHTAMADVSLLKAPAKAIREAQKGTALLKKREWAKAAEHLEKALEIDPEFSVACNNLAVAYAFLGQQDRERAMLERSLKLNDNNAAALMNRAYVAMRDNDLAGAEGFLIRAAAADPQSVQTLMVMAKVQLLSGHYEGVVRSARKLHGLPHAEYALVHYLAARALEAGNRLADAAAELRVFLQEEPRGQWSDAARKELALLEAGGIPVIDPNLKQQAARVR